MSGARAGQLICTDRVELPRTIRLMALTALLGSVVAPTVNSRGT
ncbi:hypothetical protein ACQP1S_11885 [Micromonospora matsumotoense]